MGNVFFGIFLGLFLYFAGSRLFIVITNALRKREEDNERKEAEKTQNIIDKVLYEIEKKDEK